FAMSLNLNTDDFEGGNLRFPEYGPHAYRPGAGDAVIFSCTLLHEATDVVRGQRFALLAFLYGKDESPIREANRKRRAPGITNKNDEKAPTPRAAATTAPPATAAAATTPPAITEKTPSAVN